MNINEDMKAFFETKYIEKVFLDDLKFKRKLKIGEGAYSNLKTAKDLEKYGASLATGLAVAGSTYAVWLASLGILGQMGLAVGLVSNPIGWMVLAGGTGAVFMFGGKSLIDSIDKNAFEKTPKYLNTPIDLLGTTFFSILTPLLLKITSNNGTLSLENTDHIQNILLEFGYDKKYIEINLYNSIQVLNDLDITGVKEKIEAISKKTDGLEAHILLTVVEESLNRLFDKQGNKNNFRILNNIMKQLS